MPYCCLRWFLCLDLRCWRQGSCVLFAGALTYCYSSIHLASGRFAGDAHFAAVGAAGTFVGLGVHRVVFVRDTAFLFSLAVFIYLGVLLTAGWQWLTTRRPEVLLLLMWSVGYLLFLALSLLFFDAHTPLSARIVLPLFPPFLLLLVCFATDFHRRWRRYRQARLCIPTPVKYFS
jgi:hypothetical protein